MSFKIKRLLGGYSAKELPSNVEQYFAVHDKLTDAEFKDQMIQDIVNDFEETKSYSKTEIAKLNSLLGSSYLAASNLESFVKKVTGGLAASGIRDANFALRMAVGIVNAQIFSGAYPDYELTRLFSVKQLKALAKLMAFVEFETESDFITDLLKVYSAEAKYAKERTWKHRTLWQKISGADEKKESRKNSHKKIHVGARGGRYKMSKNGHRQYL